MTRILMTGATGFVGKNLVPYLSGLKMDIKSLTRGEINAVDGLLGGYQAIIHLAGKAHDLKRVSNPKEYYDVNFELTKKLYNEFLNSSSAVFIFISSVKAAADEVNGLLTEENISAPKTDYGKSKQMAEEYILSQPLPESKSCFILRPCMIHGPGNKGNLNLLYKVVTKGIPYPLAAFENKRSFLSIENLCFVISELILRNDIPSGVYQVADDEALSTSAVVEILSACSNKKPRLWHISPAVINFIAKIGDKLHLPLNSERLTKLTESYVVSNEKLKSALKKQLPLTSREGLAITARSFQNT